MKRNQFFLALLLIAELAFLGSCQTTREGSSSDDVVRTDSPVASSRAEVVAFSVIASDPYFVGPGDVLRLKSDNSDFAESELKVTPDGRVNIEKIGEVSVSGKDVTTIERDINARLKTVYSNVECRLLLITALNRKVTLLGAVKSPGVFYLENNMTLIDAIAQAGGPETGGASISSPKTRILCRVIRDNGKSVWIDVKAILLANAGIYNIQLKSNDILFVHRQ